MAPWSGGRPEHVDAVEFKFSSRGDWTIALTLMNG